MAADGESARRRLFRRSRAEGGAYDPSQMTPGARHAFAALAVVLALVAGASPVFTVVYANSTAATLRSQLLASCAFARDLGSVPLPASPRPSKLGVSIVADSRAQWRTLRCPGELPPPSPGLRHWAAFYHLDGR